MPLSKGGEEKQFHTVPKQESLPAVKKKRAVTYSDPAPASPLYVSLKPKAPTRARGGSAASCLACQWMSSTDNPCRSVRWSRGTPRLCAPGTHRASARSACCSPGSREKARRLRSAPAMSARTSSLCLSAAGGRRGGKPRMTESAPGPRRWRRRRAWVRSCRRDSPRTPVLGTSDEGQLGANRAQRSELQQGHPRFHG